MVTMQQALTATVFHDPGERPCNDKRGPFRWRRNGATQVWVTRPGEFRIPVKHGLRQYGVILAMDDYIHIAEDCPVEGARY